MDGWIAMILLLALIIYDLKLMPMAFTKPIWTNV